MKITWLEIPGLALVQLNVHGDARGFFVERFRADELKKQGLDATFVQDNHSRSAPGVLRGIHFQHTPPQGKLVGVTRGRIFDVAVDLREGSPTFGKHFGVELDDVGGKLLWIPAGFGHGFCVLGTESADVLYKTTAYYNPAGESGVRYDDPEIGIRWPVERPLISPRDQGLKSLQEYRQKVGTTF